MSLYFGEEALREERCFWQVACSLLMSPEILDLAQLPPALNVTGVVVDIFSLAGL